ncbi:MAG: ATP phosphoribosyltransferase [Chitinophagaceae bacterium]|jgi:ATP phosphoribosyltransferase|nr:ATP phosphoribosyltransferase [Chitinophagaceae bacterium]MBK8301547.1 ATP phosphoribosyltransferase [Chitinophagaceae bacterium]MBK9464554.1 ATP phosphoribosyltransferase [Chitinophagaceae bacterium]MBK9660090.1 ATP phosphoribosyltransferase [Chitinophagaceae bacterium]MBK9939208.1 ATP phosphoribosyltransferase [Chitinophagaceae bacterium]
MQETLRIAVQKSGRLYEGSMKLLKECGIEVSNGNNQLRVIAANFPVEVFFLRDDDIPEYVQDAVADIGFVGENVVSEKNKEVDSIEKLGFGKCRLSLAVPKNGSMQSLNDLQGKKIATSYPFILSNFLKEKNITAAIHEISGSVEIAPKIGLADAICDLVSSGSTLFTNELKEIETILSSEAVLIKNKNLAAGKKNILESLLFRIRSVKKAKNNKYVLLNAPNDKLEVICGILPGMKSPTILPLAEPGWSSVHSVINEADFWNVIELLKTNGAQGILIIPIEKMII